jgi:geranylgeranyl reductase
MVQVYDAVVVGGGPSGSTAAHDLAKHGHSTLLLDKAGRIKPCGGAIPPRLLKDFGIPDHLLVARVNGAKIVSPKSRSVHMRITAQDGYVGMVDRDVFDEYLRQRAVDAGAERRTGAYDRIERDNPAYATVHYTTRDGEAHVVHARQVIGADGALSAVGKQNIGDHAPFVFAYHEVIRAPGAGSAFDAKCCDVYYDGKYSPDFYSWVFPHGDTVSVGTGSAVKGFSLKKSVGALRDVAGLAGTETIRREGAPLPLYPLKRWDNGKDVLLAGDAAGCVAPASGEGIYYAMLGGRLAADAVAEALRTGDARALRQARKRFMRTHGSVFWVLGFMQNYWYKSDWRRERFVAICGDTDVQDLTWDAYMNKELVVAKPLAHARIFFKNMAYLTGLAAA